MSNKMHLIPIVFDNIKQDGQTSRSNVELGGVDDARQLEENRKPSPDPDTLHFLSLIVVQEVGLVVRHVLCTPPD